MLIIGLWSGLAAATTLHNVTVDEQARSADLIVEGVVEEQWFETPPIDNGLVVTRSLVRVIREYKGHVTSGLVVVTTPGGYYPDGSRDEIAGVPPLGVGSHILAHVDEIAPGGLVRFENWTGGILFLGDDDSQPVLDGQGRLVAIDAAGLLFPIPDERFNEAVDATTARVVIAGAVAGIGATIEGYPGGVK